MSATPRVRVVALNYSVQDLSRRFDCPVLWATKFWIETWRPMPNFYWLTGVYGGNVRRLPEPSSRG